MDYNSAKVMSIVAIVFIVISLVVMILYLGFYSVMLMGMLSYGGAAMGAFACIILVFVVFLILPCVSLYLATQVHREIKECRLTETSKKRIIALIVLCFLGGGGVVAAIMYIIILATWNDIVNPRPPFPYYPYSPYGGYGGGYYPPPPMGRHPPPPR
jgi:hypothetical protein